VKALQLYLFDDTDPDETTYLGVARIPLITLAHDKPIQGTFELMKVFECILFCLLLLSRFNVFVFPLLRISLLTYCRISVLLNIYLDMFTVPVIQ